MTYTITGVTFDTRGKPAIINKAFGCKQCGNLNPESLLIDDTGDVHCLECDHKYNVGGKV
jgi:transcription elongation factor Elf1